MKGEKKLAKIRTNLKVFRVARNLKQEEIASKIGISRAHYAAIEIGQRDGTYKFWSNFQKAFNVPDAEMWGLMKENENA